MPLTMCTYSIINNKHLNCKNKQFLKVFLKLLMKGYATIYFEY